MRRDENLLLIKKKDQNCVNKEILIDYEDDYIYKLFIFNDIIARFVKVI